MGHLSNLTLPSLDIEIPGSGSIAVRGLSTGDIAALTDSHMPAVLLAFSAVRDKISDGMSEDEMQLVLKTVLTVAPELVAHTILLANDDPNADKGIEMATKIPVISQINALFGIFQLTFTSEAEVKKLIETLIDTMQGMTGFANGLQTSSSQIGAGDSDAT